MPGEDFQIKYDNLFILHFSGCSVMKFVLVGTHDTNFICNFWRVAFSILVWVPIAIVQSHQFLQHSISCMFHDLFKYLHILRAGFFGVMFFLLIEVAG